MQPMIQGAGLTCTKVDDRTFACIVIESRKTPLKPDMIAAGVQTVAPAVLAGGDVADITAQITAAIQSAQRVPRTRLVFRKNGCPGELQGGGAEEFRTTYGNYTQQRESAKDMQAKRRAEVDTVTQPGSRATRRVQAFLDRAQIRCQPITLNHAGEEVPHFLRTMVRKKKRPVNTVELRKMVMCSVQGFREKGQTLTVNALVEDLKSRLAARRAVESTTLVLHRGRGRRQ